MADQKTKFQAVTWQQGEVLRTIEAHEIRVTDSKGHQFDISINGDGHLRIRAIGVADRIAALSTGGVNTMEIVSVEKWG